MTSKIQTAPAIIAGIVALIIASSAAMAQKQVIKDDIYTLEITVARKADRVTTTFVIKPASGFHCNLEYPLKFRPALQQGITFSKEVYTAKEASVYTAEKIVLSVEHNNPGAPIKVTGELKMSFCDDKQCFMKKIPVTWQI